MVKRLILWDIDGTLIRTGGVGARAIEAGAAAAAALLDVPPVVMSGKTDPQILREIFRAAEIADERITALLPRAVAAVERALADAEDDLRRHGSVQTGVVEILERLAGVGGVRQTLLTGNLMANAAVKLGAFGLTKLLDVEVGAYGTDDPDRNALVPVALERVERLRGERYDLSEVWVIGDTPTTSPVLAPVVSAACWSGPDVPASNRCGTSEPTPSSPTSAIPRRCFGSSWRNSTSRGPLPSAHPRLPPPPRLRRPQARVVRRRRRATA